MIHLAKVRHFHKRKYEPSDFLNTFLLLFCVPQNEGNDEMYEGRTAGPDCRAVEYVLQIDKDDAISR